MADTIITPQAQDNGSSVFTSVLLLVIVAAIAIGAVMLYRNGVFQQGSVQPDVTDINVNIPTPSVPSPTPASPSPAPAE